LQLVVRMVEWLGLIRRCVCVCGVGMRGFWPLLLHVQQQAMRSLVGFHECRACFALPSGVDPEDVPDKILQSASMAQVCTCAWCVHVCGRVCVFLNALADRRPLPS
jgi:hypothetical protein